MNARKPENDPKEAWGPCPDEGSRWLLQRFLRHSKELGRLAGPVIFSRAGILTLALVDTVMLGPLGTAEVARYGLGTSAFIFLLVCGIGLLFGTTVETSHLRGEGRLSETGTVWRRALPYAVILASLGILITQFGEEYFLLTGQSPELAQAASTVTAIQGIGLLPMLLYVTGNFYLEAMGRPTAGMIAVWTANIVNIPLNLMLIDGGLGVSLGCVGADGAALATTLVRFGMAAGVIGYIWYLGGRENWGIRQSPSPGWIEGGKAMRRHGYAAGPAYAAESGAFHVLHIFAGWMAATQLAAFTITMNMLAMVFMATLGVASATAVRVGVAHGRKDRADRTLAGWTGVFWVSAIMALFTISLVLEPTAIMGTIYRLEDPELLAAIAPVTVVMAFALLLDGAQFTLANSLRAASDAWIPTVLNFISFIILMIPLSYFLGIYLGRDAQGLFEGIVLASGAIALALGIRWTWVCVKRPC